MSDTGASLPEQPGSSPSSSFTAFRCGILHAFGGFDANDLSGEEGAGITEKKSWFFTGEALMASLMAATIAIPAGIWFAGRTELSLAFIGAGVLFLPLFVFVPRLIRYAMKADTDAVLDAFGKNEQIRKVFWTLFLAVTGLVLAEISDPAAAEKIVETLTGI